MLHLINHTLCTIFLVLICCIETRFFFDLEFVAGVRKKKPPSIHPSIHRWCFLLHRLRFARKSYLKRNRNPNRNHNSYSDLVLGLGHDRKPGRTRLEIGSPSLMVRRRPNQRRESSLHQISLHRPDPYQRVRHRRPPREQPVRLVRTGGGRTQPCRTGVLVEATPERTRMSRRRTHTRPLLLLRFPVNRLCRDRPARRCRTVYGEPDRRHRRRAGGVDVDAGRRSGAVDE